MFYSCVWYYFLSIVIIIVIIFSSSISISIIMSIIISFFRSFFSERALYSFECAFHPLFSLTSGTSRLDYLRPENRLVVSFLSFFVFVRNHL